ncbi:MAG TPA: lactate utilization protein [Chloroflexota bacterium]|nr:lactate utilization protein [Chloroflexota bacterium]
MVLAPSTELIDRFTARCRRLGVAVHRAAPGSVAATVVELLRAAGARSALVADDLGAERDALARALGEAGIALIDGRTPREAEPAEAGVSRAAFAVAETGSLAVVGDELQPRMATMLPPVHVALVDLERLYGTLDEAAAELERLMRPGAGGTRYVSLVTGPSRTADVEKTLTVGVHGPGVVQVVLVGAE